MTVQLEIKCISDLKTLQSVEGDLELLEQSIPESELFTSFQWIYTWLYTYRPQEFFIILFYQNNEPVAMLPLIKRKHTYLKLPVTTLELISINSHGNVIHLPCNTDETDFWKEALKYLLKNIPGWDYLYIEGLLEKDSAVQAVFHGAGFNGLPVYSGDLFQVFIDWLLPLETDWDSYYAGLSKNVKKSLNNRRNQMRKAGGFEVTHFSGRFDMDKVWKILSGIDRNSWQFAQGSGMTSPQHAEFYYNLAGSCLGNGLDIWILFIGNEPAAFEFSVIYRKRVYGLRWGFSRQFASFSPGKVLRAESLHHYFRENLKDYCMMGKYPEFKKIWGAQPRKATDVVVFSRTAKANLIDLFGFKLKLHYLKNRLIGLKG